MSKMMSNLNPADFGASSKAQMTVDSLLQMDEFIGFELGATLGLGAYSLVRSALEKSTGKTYAIKFAVENSEAARAASATGYIWSRPLEQITGSYGEVKLQPNQFLLLQYHEWIKLKCDGFPQVFNLFSEHGLAIAIMEFVEGPTLRDLLKDGAGEMAQLLAIARAMHSIEAVNPDIRHGDLKPENIVISSKDSAAYVLDPGFFGSTKMEGGAAQALKMTTPAYYPFLEPDDIFAMGVIILEVLTGKNPLTFANSAEESINTTLFAEDLRQLIERERLSSNYFPSSLHTLPQFFIENQSKLDKSMSDIAKKCFGIIIDEKGRLCLDAQYTSFRQVLDALEQI